MLTKFMHYVRNFKKSESGAVTVDWVVLTAAVVVLGGVFVAAVNSTSLKASFTSVISTAVKPAGNTP